MGVEHEKWATDVLKHIGVNPEIPAQVIDEEPDGASDQPDGNDQPELKAGSQDQVEAGGQDRVKSEEKAEEQGTGDVHEQVKDDVQEPEKIAAQENVEAEVQEPSKPEDVLAVDGDASKPDLILPEDGSLQEASDVMAIAEREVGCGEGEIKFTGFSSCIGVTVRDGTKVKGVHLALIKPDGNPFNKDDATKVLTSLGTYSEAMIFGQIVFWKNPANQVADAFKVLEEGLKAGATKENGYKDFQFDDGEYGAEINEDDDFFPTF
ncbi:hypothetical protein ACQU0X_10205 [Pseudovibrio ascidiaceicola]|uniref:hypothetical protein n=1 Tax=Pseudovibrio ascidiaceicola TaxID=285279 RepID=UPI003D35A038